MDKKSVREAKAHKRDRNKLKKRKVDDNGNLAVSSARVQIQCQDAPEEKFMKNKKSVREAKAHKRDRNKLKKRKVDDNGNLVVSSAHVQIQCEDAPEEKFMKNKKSDREAKAHKSERIKSKNRKVDGNENLVTSPSHDQTLYEDEPGVMFVKPGEANKVEQGKRKDVMTKKRKKEMGSKANAVKSCEDENDPANPKCSGEVDASCTTGSCQTETQNEIANTAKAPEEVAIANRSKKASKVRKKDRLSSKMTNKLKGKKDTVHQDEVYYISSEDEDCSRGMKKWIMEYHQSRPGLKILQERIDEFITAHESQEEQARKEREIQAAEGGWTVVVHHKGRKKTTDSESGVTVGSVAQAAVVDKMSKKKSKEVGLDFYRFQRREAQRNEIMMLQSKFEQDKKRIQQLRAARKFRPY